RRKLVTAKQDSAFGAGSCDGQRETFFAAVHESQIGAKPTSQLRCQCPLLGVKRTSCGGASMSASDPKQTCATKRTLSCWSLDLRVGRDRQGDGARSAQNDFLKPPRKEDWSRPGSSPARQ